MWDLTRFPCLCLEHGVSYHQASNTITSSMMQSRCQALDRSGLTQIQPSGALIALKHFTGTIWASILVLRVTDDWCLLIGRLCLLTTGSSPCIPPLVASRFGRNNNTELVRALSHAPDSPALTRRVLCRCLFENVTLRTGAVSPDRSICCFGPDCPAMLLKNCDIGGHSGLLVPNSMGPKTKLILRNCHLHSIGHPMPAIAMEAGSLTVHGAISIGSLCMYVCICVQAWI